MFHGGYGCTDGWYCFPHHGAKSCDDFGIWGNNRGDVCSRDLDDRKVDIDGEGCEQFGLGCCGGGCDSEDGDMEVVVGEETAAK